MNRLLRLWPPLTLLACLLLLVGNIVAQDIAFASSATSTYAQTVAFRLEGPVEATVARVDLFMQAAGAERPFTVQVTRVMQNNGQLVAAVDVDPADAALPPFAEVRFWWELQTAVGTTITVPEERFFYEDDRFEWRILTEGDLTVHWTGNDEEFGGMVAQIVARSRQTVDDILPQTAVSPLNLYVYPSAGELRTGLRLAGRDWQNGHTDPDLGVLLTTSVNPLTAATELNESIPHELTHLRLYQLAAGRALPIWYEEGIALLAEGSSFGDAVLETAVANNSTLPLLNLCLAFPDAQAEAELALAQSVSLLRYLQAQFGSQALRQLGSAYLAGAGCEAGLTQTFDMSLAELNVDWLSAEAPQPAWRTFLSENGLWLLLLLASFGLLALMLRR